MITGKPSLSCLALAVLAAGASPGLAQSRVPDLSQMSIEDLMRIEVTGVSRKEQPVADGFNGVYANKLLVLVDGRSVYNRLFSGVLWDAQDLMLDDIDRIEVIRGPGAAMWGANAVNGVINIVTKTSADTQGGLLRLGGGNADRQDRRSRPCRGPLFTPRYSESLRASSSKSPRTPGPTSAPSGD